jgi:hypothetical protein
VSSAKRPKIGQEFKMRVGVHLATISDAPVYRYLRAGLSALRVGGYPSSFLNGEVKIDDSGPLPVLAVGAPEYYLWKTRAISTKARQIRRLKEARCPTACRRLNVLLRFPLQKLLFLIHPALRRANVCALRPPFSGGSKAVCWSSPRFVPSLFLPGTARHLLRGPRVAAWFF